MHARTTLAALLGLVAVSGCVKVVTQDLLGAPLATPAEQWEGVWVAETANWFSPDEGSQELMLTVEVLDPAAGQLALTLFHGTDAESVGAQIGTAGEMVVVHFEGKSAASNYEFAGTMRMARDYALFWPTCPDCIADLIIAGSLPGRLIRSAGAPDGVHGTIEEVAIGALAPAHTAFLALSENDVVQWDSPIVFHRISGPE